MRPECGETFKMVRVGIRVRVWVKVGEIRLGCGVRRDLQDGGSEPGAARQVASREMREGELKHLAANAESLRNIRCVWWRRWWRRGR